MFQFKNAEIVSVELKIMSTAEAKQDKQAINLKDIIGQEVLTIW